MRELVSHSVGGGWGDDQPTEGSENVAVIRGADFPHVTVGDVSSVPLRWESSRKIPQRALQLGDIVLEGSGGTSDRPTGRTVYVSQRLLDQFDVPVIPASFCRLVRIDPAKADPHFVYWWLQGMYADGRTWAYQNRSTGIANFQFQHFLDAEKVKLPSREEQRAIAATLGALDDKIESNRRAMAKLDELFHAMWRREYDGIPVEAEESLSEHVTTQYGLTASASSDADGDKFLRVTDINKQNWIDWTGVPFAPTDDSLRAKYSLNKGDLLVARMADPGKSAIYDGGPTAVFASYLVRLKPASYEEALFIYGFLKSSEYLDYAAGAMTGSVQKNMNAKVIVAASLRWPDSSALSRFAEHAGPLRDKIAQIVEESARLSALRDALLPELLSGRIRAADVGVA